MLHLIWKSSIALLVLFSAIEIPLRIVLGYQASSFLIFLEWCMAGAYVLDMCADFYYAHIEYGKVEVDHRQARKHYLNRGFAVDFVAAVPLSLIFADRLSLLTIALLRLIQLVKLVRLFQFVHKVQEKINSPVLRLSTFFFWIGISAHWVACIWIYLRGVDPSISLSVNYVKGLYWSVTTLATVGYGDITPNTPSQMIFAVGVMFLGVGMYGYIIGNIANVIANIDAAKSKHLEKMEEINNFIRYRDIPATLQQKIRSYYHYIWESRHGFNETSVVDELPMGLRVQVAMHLNRNILEKVSIFQGASERMLEELVVNLKAVVAPPKDPIFRCGEIGDKMYFISSGQVAIVSEDEKTTYATMVEGQFFGESALLFSQPRNATARAVSFCDLYTLDKETFDRVINKYPDFAQRIHFLVAERQKKAS